MSKELAVRTEQGIDYASPEVVATLMATVAQGLNKPEFALFAEHCRSTGLNPFRKEVWAIKAGGRLQIMTGVQGYFAIANRHPQFDGYEEGFVGKNGEELPDTYPGNDFIATWCKVYRKDRKVPSKGVAFRTEYDKQQSNWKTMPRVMLLKCAESIALRKAFPQELNGTYTAEEMPIEYSAEVVPDKKQELVSNLKTADEIAEQPKEHNPDDKLGFGKHKEETWAEVNQQYLEWLVEQHNPKFSTRALAELDRRAADQSMPASFEEDDIPNAWPEQQGAR